MCQNVKIMSNCEKKCKISKNSPVMGWGGLSNVWKCQVVKKISNVCPIAHVPHCPCAPSPLSQSRSIHYYAHMPHHPHAPLPMWTITSVYHLDLCIAMPTCPITHVFYCPHALSSLSAIWIYALLCQYAPSLMCTIALGGLFDTDLAFKSAIIP